MSSAQPVAIARASLSLVLSGNQSDLDDWAIAFPPPHEPWVEWKEIFGSRRLLLHSSEFADLGSDELRRYAMSMVDRLNGAVRASCKNGLVECFGVYEEFPNSKTGLRAYCETGTYVIAYADRAKYDPAIGPDGISRAQRWYALARSNELVADLLRHLHKDASWFDLYKAYEDVSKLCGGDSALLSKPWGPSSKELRRFKHTANAFRHSVAHAAREKPPKSPMSIKDAASFLQQIVDGYIGETSR